MPRIQLNISDQHRLWIDTQTSEYFGISDVIRGLLDDAMGQGSYHCIWLTVVLRYPRTVSVRGDKETPQESAVSASSQESLTPPDLGDGVRRSPREGQRKGKTGLPQAQKRSPFNQAFKGHS